MVKRKKDKRVVGKKKVADFPDQVDIQYLLAKGVKLPKNKRDRANVGGWLCRFINSGRQKENRQRLFEAVLKVTNAYPPKTRVQYKWPVSYRASTGTLIYVRPRSNRERMEYRGDRFRAFIIWDDDARSVDIPLAGITKI